MCSKSLSIYALFDISFNCFHLSSLFYDSVIHLVDNSLKYLFLFISDKVDNEVLLLSESNFPNNNS